jgi:anthranilate phosphoribosyltransferase
MEMLDILTKLIGQQNLSSQEAEFSMERLMDGSMGEARGAAFLSALAIKGETPDEIASFARVMRKRSLHLENAPSNLVDTAGTGGDGSGSFNISTCSALVAAGAGAKVAKHGNRAASSKSGSADVLESLGINIRANSYMAEQQLADIGICFLFAPSFHPAMKNVAPIRKSLGFRTIFNILGPLTNPAGAERQVIGIFDRQLLQKMAEVVRDLGTKRTLLLSSDMDEISVSSETSVFEINRDNISQQTISPEEFGISRSDITDLRAADPRDSARIIMEVLNGKAGACRDVVILNSAAAIYAGGLCNSIKEGIGLAEKSIDSGSALEKLNSLRGASDE